MKKILGGVACISAMAGLIASCTNQTRTTLSQSDSLAICQEYNKTHTNVPEKVAGSFSLKIGTRHVPSDSVKNMRDAYNNAPFHIPSPIAGQTWVTGFKLDEKDFQWLTNATNLPNISTICFHFGIQNFNEYNNHTAAPIYTLIVVPVYKTTARSSDGSGLDFVYPCPGSPGCN